MGVLPLLDDGSIYIPTESGQWVSEKQKRVAEIIADYNQYLQLQWIPPGKRGPEDYSFRVVDTNPRFKPYVVCFAHECDERLLAQIFMADSSKQGNILNCLDGLNAANEIYEAKKIQEKMDAAKDFAEVVARNPKSSFWHNGYNFEEPRGWNRERR
jgi:hypothetical protein